MRAELDPQPEEEADEGEEEIADDVDELGEMLHGGCVLPGDLEALARLPASLSGPCPFPAGLLRLCLAPFVLELV